MTKKRTTVAAGTGNSKRSAIRRRVLVVDDNTDMAFGLKLLLQRWSYDVGLAFDGVEGLEVARTYRPDVVLLDLGLPRLDGCGLARQIRREPGLSQVLLVAVTGSGESEEQLRTRAAGFDHHLVKPIDLDSLQEVLQSR